MTDMALLDQLEHDRMDAAHEAFLDRRDRDLPYRTPTAADTESETGAGLRIPAERAASGYATEAGTPTFPAAVGVQSLEGARQAGTSGLCPACRCNASVRGGDLCADCLAEVAA